jgi:hypothetical protein
MIDSRLVGTTAENILLSLVNQRGVFATSFNTAGIDGIVFDLDHRLFTVGQSPYYLQMKCRGSNEDRFNPQGFSQTTFDHITAVAQRLGIPQASLYFVVGFFHKGDIRNIIFFALSFVLLPHCKTSSQYRFSLKACEQVMQREHGEMCRL